MRIKKVSFRDRSDSILGPFAPFLCFILYYINIITNYKPNKCVYHIIIINMSNPFSIRRDINNTKQFSFFLIGINKNNELSRQNRLNMLKFYTNLLEYRNNIQLKIINNFIRFL